VTAVGDRAALRPWAERAWRDGGSGAAGLLLGAIAPLYAIGAAGARAMARRSRRRLEGVAVVAIGGLAVGGAGKSTLARWAAGAALASGLRPAILLRGHASAAASRAAAVVPLGASEAGEASSRYGDEALAHRAALAPEAMVVVGANRREGAALARSHGAQVVILDDGWEQRWLAWEALWIAIDPLRPFANGRTLPAGPLRRPPRHLREADAVVLIAENAEEAAAPLDPALAEMVGAGPVVRFVRVIDAWIPLGAPEIATAPSSPLLLVSSVGSPERLQRFVEGSGLPVAEHLAFPDHGAWDRSLVARRANALRERGAAALVVTDKDLERARSLGPVALPVWALRSGLAPLGDASPLTGFFAAVPRSSSGGTVAGAAPIR
jgi:tetraacyldisaccharide 4'-kinase